MIKKKYSPFFFHICQQLNVFHVFLNTLLKYAAYFGLVLKCNNIQQN